MTSLQKLGKTGVFGTPKKMKFVHLEEPEFGESICKCVYIHAMYVHVMYICLYIYTLYVYVRDHVPGGGKEVQDIWLARNLTVDWKTSIQIAPLMYKDLAILLRWWMIHEGYLPCQLASRVAFLPLTAVSVVIWKSQIHQIMGML